jgi:hypothetical protein
MPDTIGEHLLDIGVGKHLQPVGIIESLFDIKIASLAILHINGRTMVAASTHHTVQLQFI